MASSSLTSYHARSISLPSRPHPISEQFEQQLSRLNSSQTTSTSSSISLSHKLSILGDLYDCVDELLLLPLNQQTIAQNRQSKWVDDILDGSLRLLDICGTTRDALLQTKECIQEIQSALRRRCSSELSIHSEINEYLCTRRKVMKAIKNCLKGLKKVEENNETSTVMAFMLKDVEVITADVLRSSLTHIVGSKIQSKKSSWSMVSKLIHQKGYKEKVSSTSRFEDLDAALSSVISQKKKTGINVDELRSQMVKRESEIQDLDEALESLFRHLVKTRSNLLNILSN